MKHKSTRLVLLAIVILGCLLVLAGCSKKTYKEAVEQATHGKISEAISLFSELPGDYCPDSVYITAAQWIYELETEYNSEFVGKWEGSVSSSTGATGKVELNIDYFISGYTGVNFYYRMYTWSSGGVMVSNNGDLGLIDSNKAKFYNSDNSNYKYYELEINESGKIVLSFKGETVSVLRRVND